MDRITSHNGYQIRTFKGGRRIGGASVILDALQTAFPKEIIGHAQEVLDAAGRNIDSNTGGKGIALGPGSKEQDLKASGYVATPDTLNAYENAKTAATNAGSRDARRGLWAPPAHVSVRPNSFAAVIAYAAGRAILMHGGYTRGTERDDADGSRMQGVPFLEDAFDERLDGMDTRLSRLGQSLSRINVPPFPPEK